MLISKRPLLLTLSVFLTGLVLAAGAMELYVQRRFIPAVRVQHAIEQGDGCIVILGDSRMVAGIVEPELRRAWHSHFCLANLAIGALDFNGQYLALRRYQEAGRRPKAIILGFAGDTLLAPTAAPDPATLVGNMAVVLAWSRVKDLGVLYPNFPRADFDTGFRFLVARATPIGAYSSLLWQHAQRLQNRIFGAVPRERNAFGKVGDMQMLGEDMARAAEARMATLMTGEGFVEHPWLRELRANLAMAGIPLIVVHVPMVSQFRARVNAHPRFKNYWAWLATQGPTLDCSDIEGIADRDFEDGLHLGTPGALRFTTHLVRELEGVLIRN